MINFTNFFKKLPVVLTAFPFLTGKAQTNTTDSKDWVTKSNNYTKILIDIDQKYSPEFGSE